MLAHTGLTVGFVGGYNYSAANGLYQQRASLGGLTLGSQNQLLGVGMFKAASFKKRGCDLKLWGNGKEHVWWRRLTWKTTCSSLRPNVCHLYEGYLLRQVLTFTSSTNPVDVCCATSIGGSLELQNHPFQASCWLCASRYSSKDGYSFRFCEIPLFVVSTLQLTEAQRSNMFFKWWKF